MAACSACTCTCTRTRTGCTGTSSCTGTTGRALISTLHDRHKLTFKLLLLGLKRRDIGILVAINPAKRFVDLAVDSVLVLLAQSLRKLLLIQ